MTNPFVFSILGKQQNLTTVKMERQMPESFHLILVYTVCFTRDSLTWVSLLSVEIEIRKMSRKQLNFDWFLFFVHTKI